jgi:hypothetical protein
MAISDLTDWPRWGSTFDATSFSIATSSSAATGRSIARLLLQLLLLPLISSSISMCKQTNIPLPKLFNYSIQRSRGPRALQYRCANTTHTSCTTAPVCAQGPVSKTPKFKGLVRSDHCMQGLAGFVRAPYFYPWYIPFSTVLSKEK